MTARFPNLVQPWLVNQLIEVFENGGENRLLAATADREVLPDNVRSYGLAERCEYLPASSKTLLVHLLAEMFRKRGLMRVLRGISRLPRVFMSRRLGVRQKIDAILMLPYLGLSGIDVVHSHSEMMGTRAMPIVVALGVPLVITFHGLPPVGVKPISRKERERYTAHAYAILLNTEFAKRQYVSIGASPEKIKILPQGLRMDDFPFKPREVHTGDALQVLSVGRFHPDKGQSYSLEALQILKASGHAVEWHMVGNGPDRERLEAQAVSLGVADQVHFYSKLSDTELRGLYDQAQVFVLASVRSEDGFHEETQGVVLQEAQASGLITIAASTGGIPECIDDGVSGFLVPDRSGKAIADKIAFVLEHKERWEAWQNAGRQWVESRFEVGEIGRRTWQIYQDAIGEAPVGPVSER
ncbi:MAG: glycosyltransferase family 4 protein [Pseudomonadota bacterium]